MLGLRWDSCVLGQMDVTITGPAGQAGAVGLTKKRALQGDAFDSMGTSVPRYQSGYPLLLSPPTPIFPPCSSSPLFLFLPSLPAVACTSSSEAEDVLKKCESIFVSVRVQQRLCLFSGPASEALPLSVLCIPGCPDPRLLKGWGCAGGNLLLHCTALSSSSQ